MKVKSLFLPLITGLMAVKWLMGSSVHTMDMLDIEMIHLLHKMEPNAVKFHHTTQECA